MEGTIHFPLSVKGPWVDLPLSFRNSIAIKGMKVIFPDNTEANIYETGTK